MRTNCGTVWNTSPAQMRSGSLQSRVCALVLLAERRIVDVCVSQVRTDVDTGDRHTADARVLDLVDDQIRQLALDLVGDALCPLRVPFHVPIPGG